MNPSKILKDAKARIQNPKNWIKGAQAESQDGRSVWPYDAAACRFCAIGAIRSACGSYEEARNASFFLDRVVLQHIPTFNDDLHTSHADVIEAFDKAIKLAESEGQ